MRKMAFVDLTNYKDWPMGGMLEYELSILKNLVNEFDIEIWGVSVDGVANESLELNGKNYPIHVFGNVKTKNKFFPNYWRGLNLVREKKIFTTEYDIVYAHTGSCLIAAHFITNRNKTKLVYHQHGLNHLKDYSLMSLIQRPGLRLAQKYAGLVFVVSNLESVEKYAKEMERKTKARFVSIGSPVDLSRFDEVKNKEKILEKKNSPTRNYLYTGRLSAFKNVKTLIDAVHMYKQKVGREVKMTVAGSGEEMDNLARQVKLLKMESSIEMLGAVSHEQIYSLLEDADVFLTASGGEGVSVSVVEAYAAGLPVVCFNVPGLNKQVVNGVTGIVAQDKTADAFCDAMLQLDEIRTEAALNCLREAKKYDATRVSNTICCEINSLFWGKP